MAVKRVAISNTNEIELENTTDKVYLVPFSTNEILNGGGENTTDWINPTDGLAEWWQPNQLV